MTDQSISNQWREWNVQGLIPGPEETEASFMARVAFCKDLKRQLVEKVGADLPFQLDDPPAQDVLVEGLLLTEELYGIRPDWVPIFFSNHQLSPWHGGCAWIFELDENTPTAAFLQLRAHFRTSSRYLGLYHRNELIAHELAHVGRMLYQEPEFEEVLAYQSASSSLRRWLGPIVQSSKESLFFIILLGVIILTDFALLSVETPSAIFMAWGLKLIPIFLIALALGRLMMRQLAFKKCLRNLEALYPRKQSARHLLYRLRDSEIRGFARSSPAQIGEFIESMGKKSFRWRFLKAVYPSTDD